MAKKCTINGREVWLDENTNSVWMPPEWLPDNSKHKSKEYESVLPDYNANDHEYDGSTSRFAWCALFDRDEKEYDYPWILVEPYTEENQAAAKKKASHILKLGFKKLPESDPFKRYVRSEEYDLKQKVHQEYQAELKQMEKLVHPNWFERFTRKLSHLEFDYDESDIEEIKKDFEGYFKKLESPSPRLLYYRVAWNDLLSWKSVRKGRKDKSHGLRLVDIETYMKKATKKSS